MSLNSLLSNKVENLDIFKEWELMDPLNLLQRIGFSYYHEFVEFTRVTVLA